MKRTRRKGLIFYTGGIVRTLGYFALILSGVGIGRNDSLAMVVFEMVVGHVLICAAEVIEEMNAESSKS